MDISFCSPLSYIGSLHSYLVLTIQDVRVSGVVGKLMRNVQNATYISVFMQKETVLFNITMTAKSVICVWHSFLLSIVEKSDKTLFFIDIQCLTGNK